MIWLFSFVAELFVLYAPGLWRFRRILAILTLLYVIGSSLFVPHWYGSASIVLGVLLPFRVINIMRIIYGRMHSQYLRTSVRRTFWWLTSAHAFLYVLAQPTVTALFVAWAPHISLLASATMLALTLLHLSKTRQPNLREHYADNDLPTVSVCIPARNETDSLEACLRSITANDYPKLEIVVLDDCSQDKTAEIIKSFAHDGVRFIKGDEPRQHWLAKNQAYDHLAEEASGELILFCGVDVRFGPHTIRSLVTTMLSRKKNMISVMPLRFYSQLNEAFLQPMRYWWELVPPRVLFNRPPVLSTCWLIERKSLLKLGSFKAVSRAIIPEGYFARHYIADNKYSFLRANKELDVRTTKPFKEQWHTAIRTNYPQIRRRPEMALLLTLFSALFLLGPFLALGFALLSLQTGLIVIFALSCLLLTATHVLILQASDPTHAPYGFVTLPLAVLMEMVAGYTSMLKYEFGTVIWKERNVCIPVMHTIPKKDFLNSGNINS